MPSTTTTKKPVKPRKTVSAASKTVKPIKKAATASAAAPAKKPNASNKVVHAVVFNILDNVAYVLEACKCKTVMPSHLKAVAMIQNTISQNNIGSVPRSQKGGAQVMPSEYYGVDSGRYFDISQVEQMEAHMFADAIARRNAAQGRGWCYQDRISLHGQKCGQGVQQNMQAPNAHSQGCICNDPVELRAKCGRSHEGGWKGCDASYRACSYHAQPGIYASLQALLNRA